MNHQKMIKPMLIGVGILLALALAGLPVRDYLPLLLILACPLMMMLMMGSMNDRGTQRDDQPGHSHAGNDRPDAP